ncbi:MAG TPA: ABC transporter substrate-binding protein, partial [Spirochaetia bacterium]|nr:ABC transporter substrate-binding protein [Spirochaetia bacterium]
VTTRASEDDAPFLIEWGPEMLTFPLQVNLSATLGVNDERDAALRELFRDVRFRRALQHAIDGEGLAQAVVRGPFLRAAAPGLYPGSLYYDRESVVFYPYDPASARTLLAQIGLVDSDGDGIVNWTEGPMEGENLVIQVISHEDQQAAGQVAEGLVALFNQIGIQLNYRPVKSTVGEDMLENGEWEMRVTRASQEFAVPYTRTVDLGPLTSVTPGWHREGAEPRQLLPFEEEIVDVVNEFRLEPDFNRRKELMFEYNRLFTENVYFVGTVMGRYGQLIHKRIKNWPVGTPVFFYQWAPSTGMMEQFWVEPDEQKPETQPGTIPIH